MIWLPPRSILVTPWQSQCEKPCSFARSSDLTMGKTTNRAGKTTLSVLLHNWTWSHLHCSCHYARIFFSFHGFVTYCGQVSTLLVTAIPDFETIIHTIAFLNLSSVKFGMFFLGFGCADYWSPLLYSWYILKHQTRLIREWCKHDQVALVTIYMCLKWPFTAQTHMYMEIMVFRS